MRLKDDLLALLQLRLLALTLHEQLHTSLTDVVSPVTKKHGRMQGSKMLRATAASAAQGAAGRENQSGLVVRKAVVNSAGVSRHYHWG